ncbi:hydantoinase/oxoprolinase family protein [Psychromarinibacter sp. S121]|uniref:hydantoinase/oxoprolinase family protein n=1 Tax=Psychromarinibacter sp. S121 TaxID=3415127 RepID=UPI003C7CABC8
MAWRIGVDSGGTFTDVCLFDDVSGRMEIWKVPSTPHDPSEAISAGVEQGLENNEISVGDVAYFGHGTTVGTNALIQHKGAKTGLITTEGFRDLLEIGRQKRPSLYDIRVDKPDLLVQRSLRKDVPERMRHDGTVEHALDADTLRQVIREMREAGVQSIAVCFLYGFMHTDHEKLALEVLAEEFPDGFYSASHNVAPEFREFERMTTCVVNAYLGPIMRTYINRLAQRLTDLGVAVPAHLTQSNGGVISLEQAAELPVRTILSGPATGVVAAQQIGAVTGMNDLITFDMGGTSSDVALLEGGVCRLSGEAEVEGYPIKAPMLDIHTVGAGGGSIAFIDSGGHLKVGPRSAGADPGPVCYNRGNDEPTVTDANIVLQTLNPEYLLSGRLKVHQELSKQAIGRLADRLGLGVTETAEGILSVVAANMARAIRVISVQRGYDPRDYALIAFGGAGPLHATRLAKELEMQRVIIPRHPGILCAMGLLLTDLKTNFSVTALSPLDKAAAQTMKDAFAALDAQCGDWFAAEHVAPEAQGIARSVDLRYVGQNYELNIPLPAGPVGPDTVDALYAAFNAEHQRNYGFVSEGEPIQIVTLRVEATGGVKKAEFPAFPDAGHDASGAVVGKRDVWMSEVQSFVSCPIYDRAKLQSGNRVAGPAIIEQFDATTVVPPGMTARVEPHLNLIIEVLQ